MSAASTSAHPSLTSTRSDISLRPGPAATAGHPFPERPIPASQFLDADALDDVLARLAAEEEAEGGPRSPERLQERAWVMYCEGNRSPAIARELDVPERTVRHWIHQTREELREGLSERRAEQLLVALDGLQQALSAAWDGFHDEREIDRALFQPALEEAEGDRPAAGEDGGPKTPAWQRKGAAPRYLGLVVSIQEELIRLLDLRAEAAATFRPAAPETAARSTRQAGATVTPVSIVADGGHMPSGLDATMP